MTRVVVIATARPTFVVEAAEQRARAARELVAELGAEVTGPEQLVLTPDDAEKAAEYVDGSADLVVNVCASFSDANPALRLYGDLGRPVLLWAFREPGEVGDRLWLNSLCGANLYGHALVRSGGQVRLLYGDPHEDGVRTALAAALDGELPPAPELPTVSRERGDEAHAREALDRLRGRTIGAVGDAPPGFTPCEYDPQLLEELFGLGVDAIGIDEAFERVRDVSPSAQQEEFAAVSADRPGLSAIDPGEVRRHAAVTSALRDVSAQRELSAVAVRCWPEFPTQLGVCPCSSLSRLADDGVPTQCERDVYGAVTMLLLQALGAGTTYLVDTVDLDADAGVVRLWHCGSAATELAADPARAEQSVHCNRKIGVAGNFALRTGPVVMARLTEDVAAAGGNTGATGNDGGTGLRLLIASGESLPADNRFQGNTADVRLDGDAGAFVHGLVTGGFPHHTVLAWTDVRPQLRAAADLLDIPVIEW
ncbi:L-fucose isomerase-like protein [Haloactinopolyspora alba]|uniref:L-fucose isomerase-like protein n=1 Tax=Haloactinopolyspora alba TaxID=648780 RepID=A0A2P8EG15_9ACTN|nr:L-fucose isomerase-like protein [Haloactinopolyspora alba]